MNFFQSVTKMMLDTGEAIGSTTSQAGQVVMDTAAGAGEAIGGAVSQTGQAIIKTAAGTGESVSSTTIQATQAVGQREFDEAKTL